jgi:hypothetical protein
MCQHFAKGFVDLGCGLASQAVTNLALIIE